jgi:hypothetical protein
MSEILVPARRFFFIHMIREMEEMPFGNHPWMIFHDRAISDDFTDFFS